MGRAKYFFRFKIKIRRNNFCFVETINYVSLYYQGSSGILQWVIVRWTPIIPFVVLNNWWNKLDPLCMYNPITFNKIP